MELEQLKTVWQKATNRGVEGYFVSVDEVKRFIRKRSNTTISKIKRQIRSKMLISGGLGLSLLVFSIFLLGQDESVVSMFESFTGSQANLDISIFYLVFGLMVCFISVYNGLSYRKILEIEERDGDLKSSIQSVLGIVRSAINVKIYSNAIAIPGTVLGLIIADLVRDDRLWQNPLLLLLFVLGAVVLGFVLYFIARYGQYRRYGEQIRALEGCLEELREEDMREPE